ncbi:MAG: hypothetical protein BWK76_27260 [Desulfobulbaceae bacterium A2]|nr:MAG: hypothetical protein BWK76_27260 [Desulfobulbaceae bacterium A2]
MHTLVRFLCRVFSSVVILLVDAALLYARAGGGGGGHSSGGHSSGSSHSGGYSSSGSSHGSGGDMSLGTLLFIIALIIIVLYLRQKYVRKAATGFQSFPDVGRPKDFHALPGAQEFLAANPGFNEQEFLAKADKAFVEIQTAWGNGDIRPVRRFLSDGVYQRFNTQIAMMGLLQQRNAVSEISALARHVDCIEQDGLYDILHVAITGGMNDAFVCATNHDLDSPGGYETFTEYWSFLRKRGQGGKDLYFSQNCPSCSAPLPPDMGDAGNCPYCKTFVNSGEYDWVLSEITQVDDYAIGTYRTSKTADLDVQARRLLAHDPAFCVQLLEDKASNGYLQIQTAIAFKAPERMRRFVGDAAYDSIVASFPPQHIVFNRLYLNDVSIIAVEEADGKNMLHVAVKCSFQRAVLEQGRSRLLDPVIMTRREILIMERDTEAGVAKGSVYAHQCPACGAPVADSLDVKCGYCGSVLNSPKSEWIINALLSPEEYSAPERQPAAHGSALGLEDKLYTARDFAFSNVLVIFGADGSFAAEETAMANELARKWKYRSQQVEQLIQAAKARRLSIRMPLARDTHDEIFALMEKAAAVDGVVAPAEATMLEQVRKAYHV